MKNRQRKIIKKCNKNSKAKCLVVTKRSIRSRRGGTVSNFRPKSCFKGKNLSFKLFIFSDGEAIGNVWG